MAEYIEREALLRDIEESVVFTVRSGKPSLEIRGANAITDRIKSAPIADVVEVRHGKWVKRDDGIVYWYACSVCEQKTPRNEWGHEYHCAYCPNCGAKMDGKNGAK